MMALAGLPLMVAACGGGNSGSRTSSSTAAGAAQSSSSASPAVASPDGASGSKLYKCPPASAVAAIVGVALNDPEVKDNRLDDQTQLDLGCNYVKSGEGGPIEGVGMKFDPNRGKTGYDDDLSTSKETADVTVTELTGIGDAAVLVYQAGVAYGVNALFGTAVINTTVSGTGATGDQAKRLITLAAKST